MYLKALEINGFKSFANKTVIEFDSGITSIVGPNGSGKSNILDAILWVLGEQSYKNIRAKESSDVIFSGGKNKKAKTQAEVSLYINNDDKYLDTSFSDVKITRKIFKSGENQYFLNNERIRLKDIHNLFLDTGIGKQAYSVIGQGRVERIIGSSPKELREIIEEAAGVKKAKNEKEEATKKLANVKNEIEKIDYVEKSLSKRVEELKIEQKKAKLYKEISNKIDTRKFMMLEYGINEKKFLQSDFEEKNNKILVELEKLKKNLVEKKEESEKISDRNSEIKQNLVLQKTQRNNNFSKIEELKDEYSKILNKSSNLEIEALEKEKRKKSLKEEISSKKKILDNSKNELEILEKEFLKKEKEKNEISKKVLEIKNKSEKIKKEIKERTQKNSNLEVDKIKIAGENEDLEKRIFLSKNEKKRNSVEMQKLKQNFEKIVREKENFEIKKAKKEKEKLQSEKEIFELEGKIENLREKHSENVKNKNKINFELQNLKIRKNAISNAIENNETFNKSIKYILNKKINGVIGAFVNLIEIPFGFEKSIQTLSGGMFQDIVVQDTDVARNCIELLKNEKMGRASFLPIDDIKVSKSFNLLPKIEKNFTKKLSDEFNESEKQSIALSTKGQNGIIDFAKNIVKFDKSLEKVVQFVYGNSVVVQNLEIGIEVLKKGFSDRIVTLNGDIITSRGRMTGGFSQRRDELLFQKKELKKLEGKIFEKEKNFSEFDAKAKKIFLEAEEIDIRKNELQNNFKKFQNEYNNFIKNYDNFSVNFSKEKRALDTLDYEISQIQNFILEKEKKISQNIELIKNIEEYIRQNNLKLEELKIESSKIEDMDDFLQKLNAIDKDYEILKVKKESNKKRYDEIYIDYSKNLDEIEEIVKFENEKEILERKLKNEIFSKKSEIYRFEAENKNILGKIKENEEEIQRVEKTERKILEELKNLEVEIVKFQSESEKLTEKILKNEKDLNYEIEKIGEIEENKVMQDEEYFEITDEKEYFEIKKELTKNEKSRSEIGEVDLTSIEKFARENKEYENLVNQKRDLVESRKTLLEFIEEIENEVRVKFLTAYEEINKNFEYMCENILNGAKGNIKLINPEDILTTGLELSVKYKNKPEQSLLLLSGGEKSMLAVSFIMAIFMFRPSPFTFFDEIEAALDEKNTKKIVELLHNFTDKSQFILITHNKETMKGSHRLYGITMNKEIGETKVVSVDV
ncbi:chromosome segregation protein SMC [Leptotrichia sp. oral taxon 847]|uniref:chromosome segregation protein SMC n=1 Tax=Leptotrichia sp. oral taxon 847 TaxID=1785996 RepID=UPI00076800D4|nr:chromosome segregation protein SMC [Leptotrichia sp. oral taxon 847]